MDGGRVSFLKVPGVLSGQSTAHVGKVPGWWLVGQAWEEHISGATATLPAREDGCLTCMLGTKQECRLWPSIVIFGITEVTLGKQ